MPKRNEAGRELPHFDLRAAREARKMTQVEAAELLCTTQGTVARWEATGQMPLLERRYWALHWRHTKTPKAARSKRRAKVAADATAATH